MMPRKSADMDALRPAQKKGGGETRLKGGESGEGRDHTISRGGAMGSTRRGSRGERHLYAIVSIRGSITEPKECWAYAI